MDDMQERTAAIIVRMAHLGIQMTADLTTVFSEPSIARNSTLSTLLRLKLDGPLRPVELMETAGVTRGGMTKVIDQLEEAGLVERFEDPADEDGRSVRVRLTTGGDKMALDVVTVMEPAVTDFLVDLRRLTNEAG